VWRHQQELHPITKRKIKNDMIYKNNNMVCHTPLCFDCIIQATYSLNFQVYVLQARNWLNWHWPAQPAISNSSRMPFDPVWGELALYFWYNCYFVMFCP
jgi:hypothetical protein